jgi:branched-chain amino acid transport system permease protein
LGTTIWAGLVQGAIYALVASGFTLSLLPSGVFNFAQGALVVSGSYLTYLWLHTLGLPSVVALVLNLVAGLLMGVVCELVTVRPLRFARGVVQGGPAELVTTVGMATMLIGLISVIWGTDPLRVPWNGPARVVNAIGVHADPVEIVVVGASIVVAVGLFAVFRYTRMGQACRAVAEDREAAMLRGVNVDLLSIGAFACAGALAGVVSMAIGPVTFAIPTLANSLALGGFVALAIGGEGSFLGALGGGLVIGLVSAFAARYIDVNYANLSILALLLVTLSVRPKGLGGAAEARSV